MKQSKPQRYQSGNRGVPQRPERCRSGVWLTRTLTSILGVASLILGAAPARAVTMHDVRILPTPRSTTINNNNCSNLGNLVTITRTVQNYGGALPAHQVYLYVSEVSKFYSGGKVLGADLHSGRVYLPAMKGQGQGEPVQIKMAVGTEAFYANKIPGPHVLLVHLVESGVDENSFSVVGDAISTVKFPAGYCQPRSRLSPSRMHMQATAQIAPPKLRLIRETHSVDTSCSNMNRLVTFKVQLRNDGGPLAAHKLEVWVEDDKLVLPYDGVNQEKWIPPLMPGGTATVTLPIAVLQRNIGQLPGAHSVALRFYTSTALQNGMRPIATKHITIILPQGICQPKLRMGSPAGMHPKANRAAYPPSPCVGAKCRKASPKLNPQPEPPSAVHRLSLPAVSPAR